MDGHEGSVDPLVCSVWMDMKAVLVLSCAVCGWTRRQCWSSHVLCVDGHESSVDPLVCCLWMDTKAVLILSGAVCGWTRRQC